MPAKQHTDGQSDASTGSEVLVDISLIHQEMDARRRIAEAYAALKETNRRLNRRCQAAEKAARVTVEECERKGISMGRVLTTFAYNDLRQRMRDVIDPQNAEPIRAGVDSETN